MKKLLSSVALCSVLLGSSMCVAQERRDLGLEQIIEDIRTMKGFDSAERTTLRKAMNLVGENYVTPDILFYNAGKDLDQLTVSIDSFGIGRLDTNIVMGRSPGPIEEENAMQYLPEEFPIESYPGHYLILLKDDYEYRNGLKRYELNDQGNLNPLNKRDQIPYDKDPMLSTTLHEIGHIYFEGLSFDERQYLVHTFKEIDTFTSMFFGEESLVGHGCYHSHFHSVLSDDGPEDDASWLTSEQFSDIFAYYFLGHDYKKDDLFFEKKLDVVVKVLERFKSS